MAIDGDRLEALLHEVNQLTATLKFARAIACEELVHAKVGTAVEIALRHIVRRIDEALAK